jgi:hypothetical protein
MADLLSVPVLKKTPETTVLKTPSSSAGSNQGGVGYVRSYVGVSGTVPIGADPTDGDPLTGVRTMHVWAEVTHLND